MIEIDYTEDDSSSNVQLQEDSLPWDNNVSEIEELIEERIEQEIVEEVDANIPVVRKGDTQDESIASQPQDVSLSQMRSELDAERRILHQEKEDFEREKREFRKQQKIFYGLLKHFNVEIDLE